MLYTRWAVQPEFDVGLETLPDGRTVLRVRGELDMATTPRAEQALAEAGTPSTLVVDLSECTFVDSAAVRFLSETARRVEAAGGRTSIVATDPGVLRVLEITALDTMLPVHPTLDVLL